MTGTGSTNRELTQPGNSADPVPERPQTAPEGRDTVPVGHGSKTEATRERAILALLAERTIGAAAKRAGVGERTLRRWLSEDELFQAALATARCAAFEAGTTRVQALMAKAVDALEQLLTAKKYPSVRLGAARTVAELATHQHEAATILRRLDEVERAQRERRARSRR